jgi:hypothetical protein
MDVVAMDSKIVSLANAMITGDILRVGFTAHLSG